MSPSGGDTPQTHNNHLSPSLGIKKVALADDCAMNVPNSTARRSMPFWSQLSPKEGHAQQEGSTSMNHGAKVKPHIFFGHSKLAVSGPSQDDINGKFDHERYRISGKRVAEPYVLCRQEEKTKKLKSKAASEEHLSYTGLKIPGHEHGNCQNHFSFLVYEQNMDKFRTSVDKNMDNVCGSGFFPSIISRPATEMTKWHAVQTTHYMYEENRIFAGSSVSVRGAESIFGDLHNISPSVHVQGGAKLELLHSSSDSEANEVVAVSKNETSADTEAMDMDDAFKENHISGVKSSASANKNKEIVVDLNLQPEDISPGAEVEPSSSKTHSLYMKPSVDPSTSSDRWLNRLKTSASNSNEKTDKTNSITKHGSTIASKTTVDDQTKTALNLSDSWLHRWCRNNRDVVVVPQKRQFPSVAAMAMMGKVMNGFRPCELQNKGSCVVWNA